jgi:AraC-like DNA-binding protein
VTLASCFAPKLFLQTRNPEEAAAELSSSAIPYVFELLPGSPPFSTKIRLSEGNSVRLSWVSTTGAMHVQSCLPADSFAVVLDLRAGVGLHRAEDESFVVDRELAFVQSPLQCVEVFTPADFEALFVRITRASVVEELEKLLGREVQTPLVFSSALHMRSAAGKCLPELCQSLGRSLRNPGPHQTADSLIVRQLERELVSLLLQAQPNNYTRLLHRRSTASDWQLRAAEEFMRANAHLPLSLGDISLAAGVNARTLQNSFRKRRGCSPMRFLRDLRMEEVRAGLLDPEERTTVTSEAAHWGFVHFGRFSREYQARFGELPSETLRRSRTAGSHPAACTVAPAIWK